MSGCHVGRTGANT